MNLAELHGLHAAPKPLSLLDSGRPGMPPGVTSGHDPSDATRRLVEAGQQFEAYFISYLMKVMRETVPHGIIPNKQGAYFESFYDQEIGARAAQSGGIGIADMVATYVQKNYSPPPQVPPADNR
jgi:flagellar protein FlgJ